jgi:predicted TIM-barrel fold metal-dependent hydrolase
MLTIPIFDSDQHYYEPVDAFTRYLPKGWGQRTVQLAKIDGRLKLLVAGQVNKAVANPLFDPVAKPGALVDYYRGNPEGKDLAEYLRNREPLPDYYRSPAARLAKMDEQQVDRVWMLPSAAMTVEELMRDPEATAVAFHAFNQWVVDDWGFNYQDRIFTPPYLAMGDVPAAVKEVEWALDQSSKIFVVRPSSIWTIEGWRPPGHEIFDPIWARLNEAKAVVVSHIGDVGSMGLLERYEDVEKDFLSQAPPPLQIAMGHGRPIHNYLASIVCDRLFERFPNLRVASVENGADYLPNLLHGLRRAGTQRPGYFKSDPVEQFLEHVWVAPFWEDDLDQAISLIGAERVLFGSDYPHVEGLEAPHDYDPDVAHLDEHTRMRVMYANAAELTGVPIPATA